MGNATPRNEFSIGVLSYWISCVDYRWCSMGNPEGTVHEEAGIRNLDTDCFVLCQHSMDHQRAVAMIAHCLDHGVGAGETAEHVQMVGQRYQDNRWGGCDEDRDWKRIEAKLDGEVL